MTIYEQIGGGPAVTAAVDLFYGKVLDDAGLRGYFDGIDLAHLKAHQRAFLTAAVGGPEAYAGRSMAAAHAALEITKEAFDAVVGHLVATLEELDVPPEVIGAIGARLLPLEADIVSEVHAG
jgi:hemoglobin